MIMGSSSWRKIQMLKGRRPREKQEAFHSSKSDRRGPAPAPQVLLGTHRQQGVHVPPAGKAGAAPCCPWLPGDGMSPPPSSEFLGGTLPTYSALSECKLRPMEHLSARSKVEGKLGSRWFSLDPQAAALSSVPAALRSAGWRRVAFLMRESLGLKQRACVDPHFYK